MQTISQIEKMVAQGLENINFKREPKGLYEPIDYIIRIGGKRIRPRLCLTAYSLWEGEVTDEIVVPALALEVFHEFTLIHDDIMDNADIRRLQPTVHKKWGQNTAILSGDVMSIEAFRLLAYGPVKRLPQMFSLFTKTAAQVCEGQQLDMDFENEEEISHEQYLQMIGLKTGVLLACSAAMGGVLAGRMAKEVDALYLYGYLLGLAFQITDDYLDCYGDPKVFGKKIGGDIENNKKSWMMVEAIYRAKEAGRSEELSNLMKMEPSQEKIDAVKSLYDSLEVPQAAERKIEQLYLEALAVLEPLALEPEKLALLEEFARMITFRKK